MVKTNNKLYKTLFSLYPGNRYAFTFIFIFFISADVLAQLRISPTQRIPATAGKNNATARTQTHEPLSLPFFDDFSFTPVNILEDTSSNHPLDSIWVGSRSVWVSSGIGINEPSKNVASFDGINAKGLAYTNVQLASGLCDSLVSRPIKLGEPDVPEDERTSVWISFHYQWGGNGELPDKNDFIKLSFLNNLGNWVNVWEIYPGDK